MIRLVAGCIGVLVGVMMTINAALCLLRRVFGFGCPITPDEYASGWGHRSPTHGSLTLAAVAWVLYEMF